MQIFVQSKHASTSAIAVENPVAHVTQPAASEVDSPADSGDQAVPSDEVVPVTESGERAATDAGES